MQFFSDYNHEANNYLDLGTGQMGIFMYYIWYIDKEEIGESILVKSGTYLEILEL